MSDGISYTQLEHLLILRLADLPPSPDGSLTDLHELMVDVDVPRDWIFDCAKDLDERGYIVAALTMGGAAFAEILPAGRKYAEQFRSAPPLLGGELTREAADRHAVSQQSPRSDKRRPRHR